MSNEYRVSELEPGTTGYDIELEDVEAIYATSISVEDWFSQFRKDDTYAYPDSVNALDWIVTENQGPIGSCAGHGATTVGEGIFWVATGTAPVFSPWAQYRLAQKKDGIRGDRGSTIFGNIWVAKNVGFVPKSICPAYPSSYGSGWAVTDEMRAAAADWKITNSVDVRGYDATLRFLKNGQGFVYHGSIWPKQFDLPGDKIHDFYGPRRSDQHGGGHSTCIVGWSDLLCPCCQREYLILHNSWDLRWGNEGAKYICRKAYDDMSGDRSTVLQGLSDIERPVGPRRVEINPSNLV